RGKVYVAYRPVGTREVVVAGEFGQRVGSDKKIAVAEPLIELDVQSRVTEVGCAVRDSDRPVRANSLRVRGLCCGADRENRRPHSVDESVEAVLINNQCVVQAAEIKRSPHHEVRGDNQIRRQLTLDTKAEVNRVGT